MDGEKRINTNQGLPNSGATEPASNPIRQYSESLGLSNSGEIYSRQQVSLSPGREKARQALEAEQITNWNTRFE